MMQTQENPIATLRHKLKLTQTALALQLGMSPGYVQLVEQGAVATPTKLWEALEQAGVQTGNLQEAYSSWRAGQVTTLTENLREVL